MADEETAARQEFGFSITTVERGKIHLKMFDRINVDDVFMHLVNKEIFRIKTQENSSDEVDPLFKDFLLKENFSSGQS